MTAFLATRADSFAFLAISRMDACICSEAEATEETFCETCSLAAETTLAWVAVSSALPAICWLTAVSSSDEEASVLAFCAVTFSGSTTVSRVLFTPSTILRKAPWCLLTSDRTPSLPSPAAWDNTLVVGHQSSRLAFREKQPFMNLVLL